MTTPAGRYKVVERNRRLVTIDTLTGQEIGGTGPSPAMGGTLEAPRPAAFPKELARAAAPTRSTAQASTVAPSQSLPADWTTTLAGLSPGAQVQPGGIIWLSTKAWYDDAGERTVQLSEQGKGRLASLAGAMLVFVLAVVLVAILGDIFFAIAIIFVALRAGKALLKPVYRSIIADAVSV